MNKCSECNKNFRSAGAHSMHRTGSYGETMYDQKGRAIGPGPSQRRCLSTEEMLALEMQQDEKGTWRGPANPFFAAQEGESDVEKNPSNHPETTETGRVEANDSVHAEEFGAR